MSKRRLCGAGSVPVRLRKTVQTGKYSTCDSFCRTSGNGVYTEAGEGERGLLRNATCVETAWSRGGTPREGCDSVIGNITAELIDKGVDFFCCCENDTEHAPRRLASPPLASSPTASPSPSRSSTTGAALGGVHMSSRKVDDLRRLKKRSRTTHLQRSSSSTTPPPPQHPLFAIVPTVPRSMRSDACVLYAPHGCRPTTPHPPDAADMDTVRASDAWQEVKLGSLHTSDRARECLGLQRTLNCGSPFLLNYCTQGECQSRVSCIDNPQSPECRQSR